MSVKRVTSELRWISAATGRLRFAASLILLALPPRVMIPRYASGILKRAMKCIAIPGTPVVETQSHGRRMASASRRAAVKKQFMSGKHRQRTYLLGKKLMRAVSRPAPIIPAIPLGSKEDCSTAMIIMPTGSVRWRGRPMERALLPVEVTRRCVSGIQTTGKIL